MESNNLLKNTFFFDTMITPKIITFVYWLMLLAAVVGGIVVMFLPFFGGFLRGLLILIGGVIAARIWCEILIVLFKINDHLRRIADAQAPHEAPGQGTTNSAIRQPSAPQGAAQ